MPSPRDLSILHVDMDAFYAAVEIRDDPSLRGKPVIVGGIGRRGVVAAASYEARACGVRSAMPTSRARRLCPHGVYLSGRFDRYQEASAAIFEIFRSFTPLVEGISLDEAFLDVAGARRLHGPAEMIGHAIRARVLDEQGLTCSVGLARVKMLAKLASEAAKPRPSPQGPVPGAGVVVVGPDEELAFLHPLPVEALWGVGPATLERLRRFNVRTVGDLAALPEATLVRAVGDAVGHHLHALAWARDDRRVEPHRPAKSIGHEETFARDIGDAGQLHAELVRLADGVASRLRHAGLAGRTVTVKIRFGDFRTVTRSVTVEQHVSSGPELVEAAAALLGSVDPTPGVRLLGVSVSGLSEHAARQLRFEDLESLTRDAATDAIDDVRARFGDRAIGPASVLATGRGRIKRRGDTQWGPE